MKVRRRAATLVAIARGRAATLVLKGKAAWARALPAHGPRVAYAALVILALAERPRSAIRRRLGRRPRLVWGPVPIISIKYWSEAMRRAGYESRTCVFLHYPIHTREDYDVYLDQFTGETPLSAQLAPYRFFAWALRHGDVFIRFFDGGFLKDTDHKWSEARLLKLAGKRLIASAYGGDVAVDGHFGGLEDALYADYPALAEASDEIRRWVDHTAGTADVIVRNWQVGYIPRYDVVWLSQLAIDMDRWSRAGEGSESDGRSGAVTVLHAPNHRNIKGTEYLEAAVSELREEGLAIDLELLQGRPNDEIREAMAASDIVADQFLLPGYAMAAVEAMASGRPVMENMGALPPELQATEAYERCPAVDTNPGTVKDELRRLIENPGLRRELGRLGREYTERFHGYEAVARTWQQILDHVWLDRPLPDELVPRRPASPRDV